MPLTDTQKAEYLEKAGHCPFCQDWNIDGGSVEAEVEVPKDKVLAARVGDIRPVHKAAGLGLTVSSGGL